MAIKHLVAQVEPTAPDYAIHGGLPAKLGHICADTVTNEDGDGLYMIPVRTERSYLGTEDSPLEIIPGMTAVVDIQAGEKTVLDCFMKPVLRAKEMALHERETTRMAKGLSHERIS